jgi:outer membrane protein OmpA-like peptidoglycan-associated protein
MIMRRYILAGALFLSMVGVAWGGWLDDAIKNAGEGLGRRTVNDTASGVYDEGKDAVKGGSKPTGKQPAGNQPAAGNPDGSGSAPASKRAGAKGSSADGDGGTGDGSIEQAEAVYSKYDFIPGDKVIFFDDFSDTDVGEFPRKWSLNGPGGRGSNAIEVAEYAGKRFLRSTPAAKSQSQHPSTQYIRLDRKGDLPEKFTVEFDAYFTEKAGGYPSLYGLFLLKGEDHGGWSAPGIVWVSGNRCTSMNTETQISKNDDKVHHVAVSVNGTFVKAYVDNQRVVNDPDGIPRPIKHVGIRIESSGNVANDKVMFTNFRLAEGGKSIKSALDTDGKIVTHGILFDTGKDVIKAESLPTLKSILAVLNDTPDLKFSIEGHTDNQGSKAINQPLSEKRAAAVMAWLSGKGIDSARLRTKGFGDSVPIDTNATPEGRANNRRVEFVKF